MKCYENWRLESGQEATSVVQAPHGNKRKWWIGSEVKVSGTHRTDGALIGVGRGPEVETRVKDDPISRTEVEEYQDWLHNSQSLVQK